MDSARISDRTVFLDNLRSLMVVLVLIFHSGVSYGSGADFWPFHDNNPSGIIGIFLFICDVFMMAVLFFIAGYFALPSLIKKGTRRFITGKLRRLGLPWVTITILLLPALDYLYYSVRHSGQHLPSIPFPEYWILSMRKIAEFFVGWMDMSSYRYMIDAFYQRYMWFISLLLSFFVIFALVYKIRFLIKKKQDIPNGNPKTSKKSAFWSFIGISAGMIILFGLIRFNYPGFMGSGWFSLGNVIQFQFGKLVIYAGCFALGVIAYRSNWAGNTGYGKFWIWLIVCFCLFGINMLLLKNLTSSENPPVLFKAAFCAAYPLWSLSFLGFFLSVSQRLWNKATKLNRCLSEYSFRMYLVHYIVPFTLPLALSEAQIPVLAKFAIVTVSTVIFSYSVSRYILNPVAKLYSK